MLNVIQTLTDITFFDKMFISVISAVVFIQIFYWLRYSRILSNFFNPNNSKGDVPPVSVIVVVNENHLEWINGDMKELFSQTHPNYEVVAVNDCGGLEVSSALQRLYLDNPVLNYTSILPDKKYTHTKKFALLVGIKRASYDNFIFIEPWTRPSSQNWLINMSKGFLKGKDIVIGASSNDCQSLIARSYNLMSVIRYLSSAVRKRPYKASVTNYGFTRKIFFDNNGYNFLLTSLGVNDLFLQKILRKDNYSVIIGNECLMTWPCRKPFHNWFKDEIFSSSLFRFYPFMVKLSIFFELFSSFVMRIMFVASLVKLICCASSSYFFDVKVLVFLIVLFVLLLLHQLILLLFISKLSKKMNMANIVFNFICYEKIAPFFEFILSINRRFGVARKIW